MKSIEPILRKLVNNYFAKNKQANMDSEAARNELVEHIANTIPTSILICPSDAIHDYPEHIINKDTQLMDRNHWSTNYW